MAKLSNTPAPGYNLSVKSYPKNPAPSLTLKGPSVILSGVPINKPKYGLSSSSESSPKG